MIIIYHSPVRIQIVTIIKTHQNFLAIGSLSWSWRK